jgi:hypothetical protein
VYVGNRAGDGRGSAAGVRPRALTDLLRQLAASPEEPEAEAPPLLPGTVVGRFEVAWHWPARDRAGLHLGLVRPVRRL